MSAEECQLIAALTAKTLTKVRTEEAFSLFWERCKKAVTELKINEPILPRKRQSPIRYFLGEAPSKFHDNVKHYYPQIYFESIDTASNHVLNKTIYFFYGDDLDQHNQHTQPTILGTLFDSLTKDRIDISFVINRLRELTQPQKNLFSKIIVLVKFLLLAPARKTVSERSCSTLRKIRPYFRSTMTESRLNHWLMLKTHKKALGELSLVEIANKFCR